jgi:hypothetical protein
VDKLLKLEFPVAGRFYALYCEQFNPDLTVPDSVVEEWIFRGERLEQGKNHRQAATGRRLDVCRKRPTLIIRSQT